MAVLGCSGLSLILRKVEREDRAPARLAFSDNESLHMLDDLLAQGQADAGSGIYVFAVQPLKELKYLGCVFLFKSDSVVGNGDLDIRRVSHGFFGM